MRRHLETFSAGIGAFAPSRFPYPRFLLAVAIGLVGAVIFVYLGTPLPWMLGAIAATTIAALAGARMAVPSVARTPMVLIVGAMVGATFTPDILERFTAWWPTVLGLLLLSILSAALCVGYLRLFTDFNRPTAYFSGMPGGLIEMVMLSEEHGGDIRTVALIHSVRILIIVFAVPIIVSAIVGVTVQTSSVPRPSIVDAEIGDFAWLVATAIAGVVVGRILRLPAVFLLGPMLASAAVHITDLSEFKLPVELLNVAQLVIGASLGCRFVGVASGTIFRLLRLSVGMTIVLLALTAAFALVVSRLLQVDFVPVFLAYAPGGTPEMSLVAIALHIEVAFVASHHIVRLFFVMASAPLVYAFLDKRGQAAGGHSPSD